MKIGVPAEIRPNETRVAATPDTVKKLVNLVHSLWVESGAGAAAHFPDSVYVAAGATIVDLAAGRSSRAAPVATAR